MPGTAAICSTGASRTRLIEPNTFSSSRFRFGPTPGRSSNAERTLRLARRSRWYVMANRCASSRRRWTRYSAGDVAGRTIGSVRSGQEQLLAFLGQAGQRQVVQAELVEDLLGGTDLALAAVDDDEVRHRPATLLLAPLVAVLGQAEPAAEDLLVAREVVRALDGLDLEPAVLAGPRLAVLEHDHAADRLAALEVADVVALDAQRRAGQAQGGGQFLERRQRLALVGQPAGLLAGQRLGGVALGEDRQLPLLPALGEAQVDRPAAPVAEERLEVGGVRDRARQVDLARDRGRPDVVLLQEARSGPPRPARRGRRPAGRRPDR